MLKRVNTPEMTRFLGGGEETDEVLAQRHAEYLDLWDSGEVRMFRIDVDGEASGYAGWWEEEHDGLPVYEIGCVVEPRWHGHGVASAALERGGPPGGDVRGPAPDRRLRACRQRGIERAVPCDSASRSWAPPSSRSKTARRSMSVNVWMIDTSE